MPAQDVSVRTVCEPQSLVRHDRQEVPSQGEMHRNQVQPAFLHLRQVNAVLLIWRKYAQK